MFFYHESAAVVREMPRVIVNKVFVPGDVVDLIRRDAVENRVFSSLGDGVGEVVGSQEGGRKTEGAVTGDGVVPEGHQGHVHHLALVSCICTI